MNDDQRDALDEQAILYASGEMDRGEAARFEQRLANEQEAREALADAVEVLSWQREPIGPNPAYRDHVVHRLRSMRGVSAWISWRPLLTGAVAAAVLFCAVELGRLTFWRPAAPNETRDLAAPPVDEATVVPVEAIYSDLSNVERVARVREEQQSRRQRHDDLRIHSPLDLSPATSPTGRGTKM
jgi:hypothetical protein